MPSIQTILLSITLALPVPTVHNMSVNYMSVIIGEAMRWVSKIDFDLI